MYFIYSVLLGIGLLVLAPKLLWDALRHGKYRQGIRERLGWVARVHDDRPVIWIHCVSVGETQAARPLVEALRRQFPQYSIVISTVTTTGQQLARGVFKNAAQRTI